jgi:AraC-like DNA-binding protein
MEDGITTLDELSAVTGVSPHHLQRWFKAVMGIAPRVYADEICRRAACGLC